jgi:hypothetical protein
MNCPLCKRNPTAHSFQYFGHTTDEIPLYYTAPAKATARDDAYSLSALRLHLDEIKESWIWVLDCKGMEIHNQYTMQFSVAFADMLVTEHAKTLQKIVVLHPNPWIYRVVHVLREDIKRIVVFANTPMEILRATTDFSSEAKTWLLVTGAKS